jgi:hypothetical protein
MVKKLKSEPKQSRTLLKENSKFKKRVKFTTKKLQIEKPLLKKAILAIKKLNIELRQKTNLDFESNISIYIILKNKIDDENTKVKNKIIPLPHSIADNKKVIITHDANKKNEQSLLKVLESDKETFEPMSNEEFKTLLKSTKNKLNLGYIYHMFILEANNTQKYKQMLGNDYNRLYFHYYAKVNEIGEKFVKSVASSSLIKNVDNRTFIVKVANTGLDNNHIYENIMKTLYKAVSYVLLSSQKHNTIKAIVLKSDSSIPFTIFGNMNSDDLVYFE